MKVSIITAAHRPEFMDRVWESIKKQIFKDWEWIIVNDGGEGVKKWYDDNIKILRQTNSDIWLVNLERNRGRFGLFARNIGAMAASNSNIVFLDDDNEWEPDHLESLVDFKNKTGRIPYCWMHIKGKKPGSNFEKIKETRFGKQAIDLGCILWNKFIFDKYGYFRNDSQITFDWNHIARIYYGEGPNKFICTKKPTLIFWHKRY